jgi:O-antigen ligase
MLTLRNLDRSSVWLFLVSLTVVSFPWNERVSSIGIILLVLHWLIDASLIQKIKTFRFNWGIGLLWSFWVIHLIFLFRGLHSDEGLHSIEVKMCFLLLPFLFSTENYLTKKNTKQLLMWFAISCAISFVYTLSWSIYHFSSFGFSVVFQRMNLSLALMHPGYYANYFAFAIVYLAYVIIESKHPFSKTHLIHWALLVYFFTVQLFLLSKTVLLFLALFSGYLLWHSFTFLKDLRVRVLSFVIVGISMLLLVSNIPIIKTRLNETQIKLHVKPQDLEFSNSTPVRKVAWGLEWDLIKRKWIVGYGTGSANRLLLNQLKKYHYTDLVKYNMHTHNQFFHTWLDLGLLGLLLLIAWLLYFLLYSLQHHKPYLFWLMLLITINLITDDMLEIQAGAVFFILFLSLFSFQSKQKTGYYS